MHTPHWQRPPKLANRSLLAPSQMTGIATSALQSITPIILIQSIQTSAYLLAGFTRVNRTLRHAARVSRFLPLRQADVCTSRTGHDESRARCGGRRDLPRKRVLETESRLRRTNGERHKAGVQPRVYYRDNMGSHPIEFVGIWKRRVGRLTKQMLALIEVEESFWWLL
ncbi:hypothetical protein VTN02DRAFT_919 [Thermoascus thermophilus]